MAYNFAIFKDKTKQATAWLSKEISSIRTSQATPAILDSIFVESYGSTVPIKEAASITTEGARSLRISPWDASLSKPIEKAIADSRLGLSVAVDEKGVRVTFPELTSERRQALSKILKQKLEEARVTLRKERDKTWDDIQKKEKEGGMGEDEKFRLKTEMQKITDEAGKELDKIAAKKEVEISQ
jgi:ribosome recycling factor